MKRVGPLVLLTLSLAACDGPNPSMRVRLFNDCMQTAPNTPLPKTQDDWEAQVEVCNNLSYYQAIGNTPVTEEQPKVVTK